MRTAAFVFLSLLLLTACQPLTPASLDVTPVIAEPQMPEPIMLEPQGFIKRIHDPVMAKEGDTYYVFSTGSRLVVICSQDMVEWTWCGRVFEKTPVWVQEINRELVDLWAPDISFFNGKWHLYYAASTFGTNRSAIGLATNVTLDPSSPNYAWVDEGEVLRSTPADDWNAIDANLAFDAAGQPWLAFGSFWSGIKLRKIDPATGQLAADDATLYALANRRAGPEQNPAIEAPFIVQHGGYYFLFVSFDACCRGAESTYNVRVGRAEQITGPYLDRDGTDLLAGGGTQILAAYDHWRGPGHNGILVEEGVYWMVYHAYDAAVGGISKLRIEPLWWDEAGWPHLPSNEPAP